MNNPHLENLSYVDIYKTSFITTNSLKEILRMNKLSKDKFHLWSMLTTKKEFLDDSILELVSKDEKYF
jgi:hypothetical protein